MSESMEYKVGTPEDYLLLRDALIEIHNLLGATPAKPISANLFCIEHGFTLDERDAIAIALNNMNADRIPETQLRPFLEGRVPKIRSLSDDVF